MSNPYFVDHETHFEVREKRENEADMHVAFISTENQEINESLAKNMIDFLRKIRNLEKVLQT